MLRVYQKKRFNLSPAQIMVLGFALTILIGALLLNLPMASKDNNNVGFINALFTSTSSVCVTGLVVVDTGTHWTLFGKIVIISLIQIGGLGFMAMATLISIILGKKIYLRERILIQESLNQHDLSGVVRLTKNILIGTFIIEGIGAIILSFVFIPEEGLYRGIGYSLFHAISAFCNAGFDLMGNYTSLTKYVDNATISLTISALIVLGGLGFPVIFDVLRKKKFSKFNLHSKIVLTVSASLIIVGFIVFFAIEYSNPKTLGNLSMKGKILAAIFQSITPRTAGFNTLDLASLKDSSNFFTIILMFIGGSPASTAGGVKTTTLGIILFTVLTLVKGRDDVEAFKKRISYSYVNKALSIILVGLSLVIIVSMVLSLTESKFGFLQIMYEVVSAFGTVGLTLGVTPSLKSYRKATYSLLYVCWKGWSVDDFIGIS